MAAILQLRRGNTDITLTEGELYLNKGAGTIQFGSGSTVTPYKLLPLNAPVNGNINLIGNATISGILTANEYHSNIITSSVIYQSGSSKFGDSIDDTMQVTGSLLVSGSNILIGTKTITGSVFITGSKTIIGQNTVIGTNTITGSLFVSGSQNFIGTKTLTGSIFITGSKTIIGNTTISGSILFGAGTATIAPLDFTTASAVLKTTTLSGDIEVDNVGMLYYSYDGGSRGIIPAEQYIIQNNAWNQTLTTVNTIYQLFQQGNGRVYVRPNTTYEFETVFNLQGFSTAASNAILFGFNTSGVTITNYSYTSIATKSVTGTTAAAAFLAQASGSGTPTNLAITTTTTTLSAHANIKGIIRTGATGGTLQPAIGASANSAVNVNIGHFGYFKIRSLGNDSLTAIGRWD